MITYKQISKEIYKEELELNEIHILNELDEACCKQIKSQFPNSNTITIATTILSKIFSNHAVSDKRENIIIQHLIQKAKKAGWEMKYDTDHHDSFYTLKPIK